MTSVLEYVRSGRYAHVPAGIRLIADLQKMIKSVLE